MSTLNNAIDLAVRSHTGQRDELGQDFIEHPLAVMRRVESTEEKIVAVLHDIVSDTPVSLDELRARGFSERVVGPVAAMTRRHNETLEQSIGRVAREHTGIALRVKLADLAHNADPRRLAALDPFTRARLKKEYERSAELLGTSLAEICATVIEQPSAG